MKTKRTPRPLGTTELGKQYYNTKGDTEYKSLITNIINHYIRNNFSYCGQYMNLEQFSFITNIPIYIIQKQMGEYGNELAKLGDELTKGDMTRAILSQLFFGISEDRSIAKQHLNILLASQGAEYKPFISAEVTKAIKLQIDNTNSAMMLLNRIGTNGLISPMPNAQSENNNSLTINEVVGLLKTEKVVPLLEDENQKRNLHSQYRIDELPLVNALEQQGVDISKEGLNIKNLTKLPNEIKAKEHIDRRSELLDIDLDADEI